MILPRKRRGRKGFKVDHAATDAKHYLDQRSAVDIHGRELLYGEDMLIRRAEVYVRARGFCAHCGRHRDYDAIEMDHIKPRGKGGTDDVSNLQMLCADCHRRKHVQVRFGENRIQAARDFDKVMGEDEP